MLLMVLLNGVKILVRYGSVYRKPSTPKPYSKSALFTPYTTPRPNPLPKNTRIQHKPNPKLEALNPKLKPLNPYTPKPLNPKP